MAAQSFSSIFLPLIVLIGLGIGFTLWLRNRFQTDFQKGFQDLSQTLTDRLSDRVGEKLGASTGDLRASLTESLARHFLESQERLDRTLSQNRSELQTGLLQTTENLEKKFQSLELQVNTRLENIGKSVETKLGENLKEGFKHFEKVQEHLKNAEIKLASLATVGVGIQDLNNLLKLPHLRGGFGEATLERLLADFLPIGSFELQYRIDPHSTERVDAVVKMSKQVLPIDSKFPREQVLPLFETNDPDQLELARGKLSDYIKSQAKSISAKYIRPELGTTDMALLFLPSETLYFEVVRNGKLFDELSKVKVYPVSPNTLAIGLKSVSMAQEYYELARGVEKTIEDVKKARRHFDHFGKKFEELGKNLRRAQDSFETAFTHLGHYESSIFRLVGQDTETPTEGQAELPST